MMLPRPVWSIHPGGCSAPWLVLLAALASCGDDATVEPDVAGDDVLDVGEDVPEEALEEADDGSRPDQPIGPTDYPPGPYGIAVGDRLENLRFLGIDGATLALSSFYADTSVKLLWVFAASGWCSVCAIEAAALPRIWNEYNPQGLQILGAVFEDVAYNPATVTYAASYARRYRWPFPGAADQPFVLGRYFDKAATPLNMLVDLTDMTIARMETGWDEASMVARVRYHLAAIADRNDP